jgi:hypothetical protein
MHGNTSGGLSSLHTKLTEMYTSGARVDFEARRICNTSFASYAEMDTWRNPPVYIGVVNPHVRVGRATHICVIGQLHISIHGVQPTHVPHMCVIGRATHICIIGDNPHMYCK